MRLSEVRFVAQVHDGAGLIACAKASEGWGIEATELGVLLSRDGRTLWVPFSNCKAGTLEAPAAAPDEPSEFPCPDCGKVCGSRTALVNHAKHKHPEAA